MATKGIPCPICGSEDTVNEWDHLIDYEYRVEPSRKLSFDRCNRCGSEYMSPRPLESELMAFYPSDYHAYNEDHGLVARALVGVRAKKRAKFYAELAGPGKARLFDVGAGDCRHFGELSKFHDFEFGGVELSPDMAEAARAQGYHVATGTLESFDMTGHEGQYDIVSMNHVLEHVIDVDVVLERAAKLLRPGGWLVGQLPCRDSWERSIFGKQWAGYHHPRHIQAFSRKGLALSLGDAGFTDVAVKATPHLQSAISMQNFLISRGWKPRMKFGKSPIYSLLLLSVAPFEILAFLVGRSGVVDIQARTRSA